MSACALGVGKLHERLRACEVVEKLLRLALEIQIFLGIANKRRARDLLGQPILQTKGQERGDEGPRARGAGYVHAVSETPSRDAARLHGLIKHRVQLGCAGGGQGSANLLPLVRREASQLCRAEVVNAIIADAGRKAMLESRRAGREVTAKADAV